MEDSSWLRLCGSLWAWPFTCRKCEKQKRGVPGVAGGLTSGFQGGDTQEGLERHYLPLQGGGFGGVGAQLEVDWSFLGLLGKDRPRTSSCIVRLIQVNYLVAL